MPPQRAKAKAKAAAVPALEVAVPVPARPAPYIWPEPPAAKARARARSKAAAVTAPVVAAPAFPRRCLWRVGALQPRPNPSFLACEVLRLVGLAEIFDQHDAKAVFRASFHTVGEHGIRFNIIPEVIVSSSSSSSSSDIVSSSLSSSSSE